MKSLVLLQFLAFLAISVDAISLCITYKGKNAFGENNEVCLNNGYKLSEIVGIHIKNDPTFSICISFSTKDTDETDCIENLENGFKLSDVAKIDFKNVEGKKVTK